MRLRKTNQVTRYVGVTALILLLWNTGLFVTLIPLGQSDTYRIWGYLPSYYVGWPWSSFLLTEFAYNHALLTIEAMLTVAIMLNAALLAICLKGVVGLIHGLSHDARSDTTH